MTIARVTLVFQWKKNFFFYFDSILYNSDPYNNKCKRLPIYKFLVLNQSTVFMLLIDIVGIARKIMLLFLWLKYSSLELGPSFKVCWTLCSFRWLRSSLRKTLYAIYIVTEKTEFDFISINGVILTLYGSIRCISRSKPSHILIQ